MNYLKRLIAALFVGLSLSFFFILFPFAAVWYVATGKDLTDKLTSFKLF